MISVVLVSYRSAALAQAAIGDLRRDAAHAAIPLEVIVVVNSGDAAEAAELEPACDRVFLPERNLGYAGGLNLGVSAARGETLLLSNPDLRFAPGALAALEEALLAEGFAAVGPAFHLDPGRALLVPPFDEPHPFELARRRLAREPRRALPLLRRDLARAAALDDAVHAGRRFAVRSLPGALLGVRRETFDRVGPFDEGYRLYYEENDWERRLRRLGGSLFIAGGARVVHRYGRTTRNEPLAAAWFAESERRYFSSHFGRWGERSLAAFAETPSPTAPAPPLLADARLRWERERPAAILLSPHPEMRPFAYARPEADARSWRVPEEFLSELGPEETWYARAVSFPSCETLAEGRVVRPTAGV